MNLRAHAVPFVLVSLVAGCGSESPPGSPLATCDARYACASGDVTVTDDLRRDGDGRCSYGLDELREDGAVAREGLVVGTWTGDARAFTLCRSPGDRCWRCSYVGPAEPKPAAPSQPAGRCTGSPSACYGRLAGSCSTVQGCRMETRVRYDGTFTSECAGAADSCSSMRGEDTCASQGCRWE